MLIFILFAALLVILSFFNYKKSFYFYLFFKLFLNTNIVIISSPGIPLLTLEMMMDVFYIIMYFVLNKFSIFKINFPLKIPFILLVFSYFCSCLFSYTGLNVEISAAVKSIVNLIFILMIWINVKEKKDYLFLLKGFVVIFFLSCIYGFYESYIQENPLYDYEISFVKDLDKVVNFQYSNEYGRGYRTSSIFTHCIGAGLNYGCFIIASIILFLQKDNKILKLLSIIVSILSIISIFLTNSRSPLLFLAIALFAFFKISYKNNKKQLLYSSFLLLSAIFLIIFLFLEPDVFTFLNFKNGSNLNMRINQFQCAYNLLIDRPLFGYGTKITSYLINSDTIGLLGLESIWLQCSVYYGVLGILAYSMLFITLVIIIPLKKHNYTLFVLGLAFLVVNTVTSTPAFKEYLFYLLYFYIYKFN